jgi:hypothetical protein
MVAGPGGRQHLRDHAVDAVGHRARAPIGASASAHPSPARRCGRRPDRPAPGSRAVATSWRPSFMVLLRGSNTARMRGRPPAPQAVDRGADRGGVVGKVVIDGDAVGTVPRTSMRRRTFSEAASASAATAGATPTWSAAAMAASALSWLCTPPSAHCTRATLSPVQHVKGIGLAHGGEKSLTAAPKLRTSLQQPACSTRARLSSSPLTTMPPGWRHGAHQVVELALDRGQVVKDVGVVELQVVQHGGARAVMHELAALVEEGGVVFVGFDHERRGPRQAWRPGRTHRNSGARRPPESPAAARPGPASRPASRWWWSCRACRPPPAHGGPAARARPATAGRWCRARRRPEWLPSAETWRCRRGCGRG